MRRLLRRAEEAMNVDINSVFDEVLSEFYNQAVTIKLSTMADGVIETDLSSSGTLMGNEGEILNKNMDYFKQQVSTFFGSYVSPGNVTLDYSQGDDNAGVFAILAQQSAALIASIMAMGASVYIENETLYIEGMYDYPNLDELMADANVVDYGEEKPPLDKDVRFAGDAPISFEDMRNEDTFNSVMKQQYFKSGITFNDVTSFMDKASSMEDKIINLIKGMMEKPPLYFIHTTDRTIAYATELATEGMSGIGFNANGQVLTVNDEKLLSIIAHEIGHELDAQNDLTSLEPDKAGNPSGDLELREYLTNPNKFEHDTKDWDYANKMDRKLQENFADLFAAWSVHHVYGNRLKKADEDVFQYLDYLFGYATWAATSGDMKNDPDKELYPRDTIRRYVKQFYDILTEELPGLGYDPNDVKFSYENNPDGTVNVILTSSNKKLIQIINNEGIIGEYNNWLSSQLPGVTLVFGDEPGDGKLNFAEKRLKKLTRNG